MMQLTKLIAADWNNNVDEEEKEKYDRASREAMEEYKVLRAKYEKTPKYKRYKTQLKDWNEVYREEYNEQQYEKKQRRLRNKKKKKKSAKSKTKAKTNA